jgi:hypothetical protein
MDPSESHDSEDVKRCPNCRSPLQPWPTIDGEQDRWLCPRCDLATGSLATELPDNGKVVQHTAPHDPRQRFRWLLDVSQNFPPGSPLPEWIIEDLPEQVQNLLRSDLNEPRPNLGPKLSDALTSSLRDQGYVIEEDARGVRLGGDLNRRGGHAGQISPYDVIRMAADLDGGLPPAEELRRCPKCEAVIPPQEKRCPWCGTALEDPTSDSEQD